MKAFKQSFTKGVNNDYDELRVEAVSAVFIKNMTLNLNVNPNADAKAGSNYGVYTPLESNVALGINLPAGTNYCVGFYNSEETNEGYAFVYNSTAANKHIWVINGNDGTLRKVHQSVDLPFILDPEYFIAEGMCTMFTKSYIDPVTSVESAFKFLIFTNDNIQQYFISVEDSIATNSYTSAYFAGGGTLYDRKTLIHLGVPTPVDCIKVTKVAPEEGDEAKQNLMIRKGWQWRLKWYDVFGRPSIHGKISTPYITLIGGGCLTASNGLSRCVDLEFDAGNPLVDRIDIEFRTFVSEVGGEPVLSAWFKYDTVYRWDKSTGVPWYSRPVNPNITFNAGTNKITYRFCGDKNCAPVDAEEAAQVEPGLARRSHNVAAVNQELVVSNNTRGFQPVKPTEIEKITFDFIPPGEGSTCDPAPLRDIEVYIAIENPFRTKLVVIRGTGWGGGTVVFGEADCASNNPTMYDQVFAGTSDNEGFPAYLVGMAGAAYATTSEQVDFDLSTGTSVFQGNGSGISFAHLSLQRIRMKVPAGKYILRLGSHKAKITDPDFHKTSTQVLGVTTLAQATSWYAYYGNPVKEIEIDCTAGNVIHNQPSSPMFVVMDMTFARGGSFPCLFPNRTMAVDGYFVEDEAAGVNTPIEMNPVLFHGTAAGGGGTTESYGSFFTDHNGYFFAATKGLYMNVHIATEDCSGGTRHYHEGPGGHGIKHGRGTGTGDYADVQGYWKNKVSLFTGTDAYPNAARRYVEGMIGMCSDNAVGIPGIPVVMTKCGFAVTDSSGEYKIIAHNRYNYATFYAGGPYSLPSGATSTPNYATAPGNIDKLIYSQKGGCAFTACDSCNYSVPDEDVEYLGCGADRTVEIAPLYVKVAAAGIFGIQSGGRYPVGFCLLDNIGRRTFVQVRQDEGHFVEAPNLNDTGYRKFALGSIGYTIPAGVNFGPEFTHLSFCVAPNTRFRNFFTWAADWIQFVDNTGITNTASPTQIRIYYNSLREYNKQNGFSTTVNWDFIANTDQGMPVKGDIVEFIMNGDGVWFDSVIAAQVTYAKDGQFFTIDFTNDLSGLINGSLFRVIRPKNCQGNYIYYEQCLTIKLTDGVPPAGSGVIPYQDSYILARQLPVPILAGQTGPIAPGGTPTAPIQYSSTDNDPLIVDYTNKNISYNNVVKMSVDDAQTSFPFYFESTSPSDLWGACIRSIGRPNVENPDECEQRIGTEVSKSGVLSSRGVLNFLGYFREENSHVFDRNTWGNIMSTIVDVSQMLVICERDHFVVHFGNTQVRVNERGDVISQNAYGMFTAPERRSGTGYGCDSLDINTIKRYGGKIVWLDRSGYLVFHDFNVAKPFEGNEAYLNNKISRVNVLNASPNVNGKTYFIGGIDPKTEEYFLSTFNLPASGSPSYFNALDKVDLSVNETSIYSLVDGGYKGMVAFTPEYCGMMPNYYLQKNFITFKNGVPYIHHRGVNALTTFNNFYGIQAKKMIELVINPEPEKVKRYQYCEVYCKEHKFEITRLLTESGQQSIVPAALWDKADNFWMAAYRCATNSVFDPALGPIPAANPLIDGDLLIGRYMKAMYKSENADDDKYCEISAIVNYYIPSEQSAD